MPMASATWSTSTRSGALLLRASTVLAGTGAASHSPPAPAMDATTRAVRALTSEGSRTLPLSVTPANSPLSMAARVSRSRSGGGGAGSRCSPGQESVSLGALGSLLIPVFMLLGWPRVSSGKLP